MQRAVCNLLAALPQTPWTKPLNWNLHMTSDRQKRIPFHLYVQPTGSAVQPFSFPQFSNLPIELQFRVLAFCSAPTLFQVMRVSSTLRIEASKLFWTDQSNYYIIDPNWLIGGGQPSDTYYELTFLAHVENVEVEDLAALICTFPLLPNGTRTTPPDMAKRFWNTLRKRCPRVKMVVINAIWVTYHRWPIECISVYMQDLIQSCPPEIDVSVNVLEREDSETNIALPMHEWQSSFYLSTLDRDWRKLIRCVNRNFIMVPAKRFYGPVGEFSRVSYEKDRIAMEEFGLKYLAIEALDRYHFDDGRQEPFSCPEAGCDAYFEKAGQFTMHVVEMHAYSFLYQKLKLDMLPEEIRKEFKKRNTDLERKLVEVRRDSTRMFLEWNKEGPDKRRDIERAWIDQLDNDELWGSEEVSASKRWDYFKLSMHPTWIRD